MPISTIPAGVREFTVTIQRPPVTLLESVTGVNPLTAVNATTVSDRDALNTTEDFFGISVGSDLEESLLHEQFYGIALPVIAGLGIIGELINLVILNHKHMRSSSSAYFTALSLSDMLFLVCVVMAYTPRPLLYYVGAVHPYNEHEYTEQFAKTFIHVYPVIEISQVLIMLYVVSVLVDHYVYVFLPRQSMKWTTRDVAQRTIFMIFGLVVLVHLPNLFKLQVQNIEVGGEKFVKVCLSTLYLNSFIQIYEQYIYLIALSWLPFIFVLIMEIVIVVKIRNLRSRADLEKPNFIFRDGRSNLGVLGTASLHLISVIPSLIGSVDQFLNPTSYEHLICLKTLKTIKLASVDPHWEVSMVIMSVLNSSLRCPILCIFHKQYRRTLKKLCFCCKISTPEHSNGSPPYKPPGGKRSWICFQGAPKKRESDIYDIHQRAQRLNEAIPRKHRKQTNHDIDVADYDYGDSQYANPKYTPPKNDIELIDDDVYHRDRNREVRKKAKEDGTANRDRSNKVLKHNSNRRSTSSHERLTREQFDRHSYQSDKNHRRRRDMYPDEEEELYSSDQESMFSFRQSRQGVAYIHDGETVSNTNPNITFKPYKGISGAEMSESWI